MKRFKWFTLGIGTWYLFEKYALGVQTRAGVRRDLTADERDRVRDQVLKELGFKKTE